MWWFTITRSMWFNDASDGILAKPNKSIGTIPNGNADTTPLAQIPASIPIEFHTSTGNWNTNNCHSNECYRLDFWLRKNKYWYWRKIRTAKECTLRRLYNTFSEVTSAFDWMESQTLLEKCLESWIWTSLHFVIFVFSRLERFWWLQTTQGYEQTKIATPIKL